MKPRILIAALLAFCLSIGASQAQMLQGIVDAGPPASASYTGPGDIVSGATAWWGLRGYNAAYSGNVAQICDGATGLVCVTATWTAAGGLSIPLVGGVACNNTTAICDIATFYDQSGSLACNGPVACDITQATVANRASLVVPGTANGCANTADYCIKFTPTQFYSTVASGLTSAVAQPFTVSTVIERTGQFTTETAIFVGQAQFVQFDFASSINTILIYSGSSLPTATATDSAYHAIQAIWNNASSNINVDNTSNVVSLGNSTSLSAANIGIFGTSGGSIPTTGFMEEMGLWPSGFSSGNQTSMSANQHTYWNF